MRPYPERRSLALILLISLLAGCLGDTPERVSLRPLSVLASGDRHHLLVEQELHLSRTMLTALRNGVDLYLGYQVSGCGQPGSIIAWHTVTLRYAPLRRAYEVDQGALGVRRFARRSAMLAALERIRIELPANLPAKCSGSLRMVLDLTRLPTPLRFPALLRPAEWRLVSPSVSWQTSDV